MTRRTFTQVSGGTAFAAQSASSEEIVMLVYSGMTLLDLIGPQQVFGYLRGACVSLVAKTKDPVVSDTGVRILPDKTFAEAPSSIEVLFVPGGGKATADLMTDAETIAFLAERGAKAKYVTSVCSGSLVLGAAGLLRGYKATSHWAVRDVLSLLGAEVVDARVAEDRNRITAGGITSGIDFGLQLAAKLRGEDYARSLELTLEYDPKPPFGSGTPEKAPADVSARARKMYEPLRQFAQAQAGEARKKWSSVAPHSN